MGRARDAACRVDELVSVRSTRSGPAPPLPGTMLKVPESCSPVQAGRRPASRSRTLSSRFVSASRSTVTVFVRRRCRSRRRSARLRRAPVPRQRVVQPRAYARDGEALLRERVPIPHGHGLVLERLLVDGEGPWRTYFVLAAVTPADLSAFVVLDDVEAAQLLVQRAGAASPSRRPSR